MTKKLQLETPKMLKIIAQSLGTALLIASSPSSVAQPALVDRTITLKNVSDAEQAWCNALIDISSVNAKEGQAAAKKLAEKVLDSAYGYQLGTVAFKPTLTVNPQTFRTSRAGALAYFVGGDSAFPKDTGFALKDWTKCEVTNAAVLLLGNYANSMGKVKMTDKKGSVTTVDKTWGWVKDDKGQMRIVLHHSSLEFAGQ
jgi:hypothetical protein